MKRFFKVLIWLFSIGLLIGIVTILAFIIYLETSIDRVISKEHRERLYTEIRESPELPETFHKTVNNYYLNYFRQTVWGSIYSQIICEQRNNCQCRDIDINLVYIDNWVPFTKEIVALDLEENFSQKKCYEYNMSVSEFGSKRGVLEAAKLFYNKKLTELNEREVLELNIIRSAPGFYSPFTNKENLDKAVENLINKN